uniref:Uncharacterized protein n=1 Tax=Electrophorus electricus TaxID=8005 RepID=A0AAY5F271_ELEEL
MCSRKPLNVLSSVFMMCELALLGVIACTDYWLYLSLNHTTSACSLAGECMSSLFPLVSLFFMVFEFVLKNFEHPHHSTLSSSHYCPPKPFTLSFLLACIFIVNRTKSRRVYFSYKYGWSFTFATIAICNHMKPYETFISCGPIQLRGIA